MPPRVVLAIDQGTTSVRALVLDASLSVLASAAESVPRSFPRSGWVETDAEEVVAATERVAVAALEAAGLGHADVAGVGFANQGETVVVWERATGRPIAPAIGWQCRRTEAVCAKMREDAATAALVRETTGLPIDAYFSATKLAWLLDETPGARQKAESGALAAGTLDSFTLFKLSAGRLFVTDPSTSCRTLLARLSDGQFSDELCALFRVPRGVLGSVVSSDAELGDLSFAGKPLPLRAILCDQPSALFGTGCLSPGDAKCTYGTGAFVQANLGTAVPQAKDDGLLRSIAWELGGERSYLLEGSVLAAGDVLTWLSENLGLLTNPAEVEETLRRTPDSGGVLFVPALTGLGAPRWVGEARGLMLGLHRGTRREHLIRAALEGVAHQIADVLDAAAAATGREAPPLWADGGMAASDAFLSLQADLSGRALRRAGHREATTRGVAAIAAARAGLVESAAQAVRAAPALTVEPTLSPERRAEARDRYRRLVDLLTSTSALSLMQGTTE
ncbi:MAG: glycerol kinase [Myxococcales bacterium]|nr:glycerol kinase [Myxococcales bacterium]